MTPSSAPREKGRALRLLILGGTTEASALARAVAGRADIAPLFSLAGRTQAPLTPPIPHRIGGFGGAEGLATFLVEEAIDAVVDATHPFAARISANAAAACRRAGVPLAAFTRLPWSPSAGDQWIDVADIAAAVALLQAVSAEPPPTTLVRNRPQSGSVEGGTALPCAGDVGALPDRLRIRGWKGGPVSVFLTTGRLDLARFRAAPEHRYLVRTIDPPSPADVPVGARVVLARPPFSVADEVAIMQAHRIDLLVTKNSGGTASVAKLAAARDLGVPVLMIERPPSAGANELHAVDAVLAWVAGLDRLLAAPP